MTKAQVRYFYNKETNVVYRVVNNSRITLYYQGRFVPINERDLGKFL